MILETFLEAAEHLTLQELLVRAKLKESGIGFATVYRTMKLLTEAGIACEHRFGDGQARYELAEFGGEHHDHLICTSCGRIEEFEDEVVEAQQELVVEALGWSMSRHVHEIYGLCPACLVT